MTQPRWRLVAPLLALLALTGACAKKAPTVAPQPQPQAQGDEDWGRIGARGPAGGRVVQLRGGTAAEVAAETPAERELLIEITNDRIFLGDGVALGGAAIFINQAEIQANFEPLDSDLLSIAALTTTAFGRGVLDDADAAALRTTAGLGSLATQSGTFSGTSSGTNTGDQTITLSGDISGTGTGAITTTIGAAKVTLAMMANLAQDQFIGRTTASTGVPQTATITAAARSVLDETTTANMLGVLGGQSETTASSAFANPGPLAADTIPYVSATDTITTTAFTASARTFAGLSDPNADRVVFWDDSASSYAYLTMGTNLTITGTTLDATGGGSVAPLVPGTNLVDQRNGTNAQTFNVHGTYTNDANRCYGSLVGSATGFTISAATAGSCADDQDLTLTPGGNGRVVVSRLKDLTGNEYTLSSGYLEVPTSLRMIATGGFVTIGSRLYISTPADGVMKLGDSTDAAFNRIVLGGTTSSFPALKRSTTALHARLADDSAFTDFHAAGLVATSLTTGATTFNVLNTTATTVNAFGAATTLNIGAAAAMILNFGGSTTASEFRYLEPSASGANYSAFKAVAQGASITYSLPPTVGAAGTVLTDVAGDGVLTWAAGGGGGAIGSTVTSGTAGSILFVGSGPVLAQDNTNLFWDAADTTLYAPFIQAGPRTTNYTNDSARLAIISDTNFDGSGYANFLVAGTPPAQTDYTGADMTFAYIDNLDAPISMGGFGVDREVANDATTFSFFYYDPGANKLRLKITTTGLKVGYSSNSATAWLHVQPDTSSRVVSIFQGVASQSADLTQWQKSDATVYSLVDAIGAWHPPHMADATAQNDSLYYSTDGSKLTYKDPGGTPRALY